MTTSFIGNSEKLHWKCSCIKWRTRIDGLTRYANGGGRSRGLSATIDDTYAHFSIPPMGDRGAIIVTLPLDPPEQPDWDLYGQLIAVEECLNG